MDYTILINREHPLDPNYIPEDLVITDENENNFHRFKNPNLKPMIDRVVYEHFLQMSKAAADEGMEIMINSGYRSYEYQQEILIYNIERQGIENALRSVALPGTSEHQSGLAFDICYIIDGERSDYIGEDQKETKWLFENAHKFGFILRYPEGKEEITGYRYEPWHYRYVGKELAEKLYKQNLTLEEYYLEYSLKK